jgi:hypothetical protein
MVCHFVDNETRGRRRFSDPSLKAATICSEDLVVTFHQKTEIELGQSWAVGYSILELSKLVMLELYYDVIQPRFPGDVSILGSDTDSLMLLIRAPSEASIYRELEDVMDFSNFKPDSEFFDMTRKNDVGYLKSENTSGLKYVAFAGLKSKSYCLKLENEDIESRAKGVKASSRKHLSFNDYKETVLTPKEKIVEQHTFLSRAHNIRMVRSTKTAFTTLDDKRYATCAIHSTPYGSTVAKMTAKRHEEAVAAGDEDRAFPPGYFCERPQELF